ncbi:substrate-binding domain-containing protein [Paenibacillus sp. MZ04-78.2]|uniref:substrate-binding domain-containing protein n=1 Tax=Paenibacillus sp. MZ04-78.2 TaxID=2962034 RepID=UPI0020B7F920|nr:substrate-binding domain-containing protein [Paenibacillus sp. MZ04-78.2]MCP3772650.1 substrate-binding domain-containing protein [Paenibacillus sp. MZ04-78.2]
MIRIGSAHEFYLEEVIPRLPKLGLCTINHFGTADQLLELLKEDKVDILITSKKVVTPGIEYVKLYDEQFVVVAPARLEVLETDSLKRREQWLAAQNWISYGLELPIIRRFWREHFKKRPLIKPVHVIPNLHIILKAIEIGEGLSMMPTYLLEKSMSERTKVIYGDLSVKNEIFFAYKMKHKHLPEIHELMKLIRKNDL